MVDISIIVPIYNTEKYLNKCVKSIINQTFKNMEIILINDGSKDNSYQIMREWEQKDNRIIVLDKRNGGVSTARNLGIKFATGTWITFLDSDDWYEDEYIEEMLGIANRYQVDMVRCDAKKQYGKRFVSIGSSLKKGLYKEDRFSNYFLTHLIVDKKFDNSPVCSVVWTIYKKDIISNNNIKFDEKAIRCEDFLFNLSYIMHIKSFYYMKGMELYCIRDVPSSKTQSKYVRNIFEEFNYAYKQTINIINRNLLVIPNIEWQLSNQIIFYALISISNEISYCNNKSFLERIVYIKKTINDQNVCKAFKIVSILDNLNLRVLKIFCIKYKKPMLLYFLQWLTQNFYAPFKVIIERK